MMEFTNLEEAVEELKKNPGQPVRAHLIDLDIELRAIEPAVSRPQRLGDFLASLGPWKGETLPDLLSRLREARETGGSAEPPKL